MILKAVHVAAALTALAVGPAARAQQGPLADPIPRPIPQSPIRVALRPVATGLTSPIFLTVAGREDGDGNDDGDRGKGRRRPGRRPTVAMTGSSSSTRRA